MRVVAIGLSMSLFMEHRILVFFKLGAPPELAEVSIIHEPSELRADVRVGDYVVIGGQRYRVTAVGELANENIRELGHMVIRFDGQTTAQLPGYICVEDKPIYPIKEDMLIRVLEGEYAAER